MTNRILLSEFKDEPVPLSEEDVRFIDTELARKITIRRGPFGSDYFLNPNQYVGVIALPSGRRLECRPKIPVTNLFYMLAVALDLPSPFRNEVAQYDELDEVLEFVAQYFADLVENRIAKGLYRWYVEAEDNLPYVRGRISFAEDVRQNVLLRQRTYCRYTDFTWDIPENQVLRQVAYILGQWGFRTEAQRHLSQIDRTLAEVSLSTFTASIVDTFHYHRLNADYRQLHKLCRLFLEGASLSESIGPVDFRTFLVDMNDLFEEFITQVLIERTSAGIEIEPQYPMPLDEFKKVTIQPDLLVRKNGQIALVADCKYKRIGPGEFQNHDLYQMLAYCLSTNIRDGLLIYPRHVVETADRLHIRNASIVIRRTTIDLGRDLSNLVEACGVLAGEVFGSESIRLKGTPVTSQAPRIEPIGRPPHNLGHRQPG